MSSASRTYLRAVAPVCRTGAWAARGAPFARIFAPRPARQVHPYPHFVHPHGNSSSLFVLVLSLWRYSYSYSMSRRPIRVRVRVRVRVRCTEYENRVQNVGKDELSTEGKSASGGSGASFRRSSFVVKYCQQTPRFTLPAAPFRQKGATGHDTLRAEGKPI
jgi:hypothetical protein